MHMETKVVHAGYTPESATKSVAVPIYQTTGHTHDETRHASHLFDVKVEGDIYTRIMNPTQAVLERRVAAMEGGAGALALASGQAATICSLLTVAEAGDNFVSTRAAFGGIRNLFAHTMPQLGIEARFVFPDDHDGIAARIDERTKAVHCESIGNPDGNVADLEKIVDAAHAHGVPVIVDNTVPTPYLCRPFEHGCDIVVHSLTKYLGGHGTIVGGVLVDSGTFDWSADPKRFRRLNEPDASYHGVVYTEAVGELAYIIRARLVPLRDVGATIAPMNAFLALQGIETLAVRMDRICNNALAVARFLRDHPRVAWVRYAALHDSPEKAKLDRYCDGHASGVLGFGIRGGREEGARFIDALKLVSRVTNIGDAKSLADHPATTSYRDLSAEALAACGLSEELVRLSIGIEHIDDIVDDLDQGLAAAR